MNSLMMNNTDSIGKRFLELCDSLQGNPKITECEVLASYLKDICNETPDKRNALIEELQNIAYILPYLSQNECHSFTGSARDLINRLLQHVKFRHI